MHSEKWYWLHKYNADGCILRHTKQESQLFLEELKKPSSDVRGMGCVNLNEAIVGLCMSLDNECEHCAVAYNKRIDELLIEGKERLSSNVRQMICSFKGNLLRGIERWHAGTRFSRKIIQFLKHAIDVSLQVRGGMVVGAHIFLDDDCQ